MGYYLGGSFSSRQSAGARGRYGVHSGSPCRSAALVGWLAVVVMLVGTPGAGGAESPAGAAPSPKTPNEKALAWLDGFATEQVLFHDKDIDRLRKKMVEATPEKAQQWLDETADLRRKLGSPEWQKTRKWLGEFLKVQAIYSDKQLEEFTQKAMTAKPAEIAKMMRKIEDERSTLASNATESAQHRQQTMQINNAFKQKQFAQRQTARRAASQAPRTGSTKVTGKPSYAARSASRAPLVNSLDAARWGVYRGLSPRW
jgi:hypothetical protein